VGTAWVIGGTILVKAYFGLLPDAYVRIILIAGFPWFIASYAFVAVRREAPKFGLPSTTGRWAVFQGVVGVLVFGIAEAVLLFGLLQDLLRR
jgi:hypothetical protein